MDVLLKGYYGFGNLGDDALLLSALRLVRRLDPEARVTLGTNAPSPGYLASLVGEDLEVMDDLSGRSFDLIVRGGGGVFFDWTRGATRFWWLNRMFRQLPASMHAQIYQTVQTLRGREGAYAPQRLALGVEVGGYHPSARGYLKARTDLALQNQIVVRDPESVDHLTRMGIRTRIEVGTDLAFLPGGWKELAPPNNPGDAPSWDLGVIYRDPRRDETKGYVTEEGVDYEAWALKLLDAIRDRGFRARAISLDSYWDRRTKSAFQNDPEFLVWEPVPQGSRGRFQDFLRALRDHRMLLSARAHGVILGASLRIPSIALGVNPKLMKVGRWFPKSGGLMDPEVDPETAVVDTLLPAWEEHEERKAAAAHEVRRQEEIAERMEADLVSWAQRTFDGSSPP